MVTETIDLDLKLLDFWVSLNIVGYLGPFWMV